MSHFIVCFKVYFGSAWLAQLVENVTLLLRVMSLSPTLDMEPTLKRIQQSLFCLTEVQRSRPSRGLLGSFLSIPGAEVSQAAHRCIDDSLTSRSAMLSSGEWSPLAWRVVTDRNVLTAILFCSLPAAVLGLCSPLRVFLRPALLPPCAETFRVQPALLHGLCSAAAATRMRANSSRLQRPPPAGGHLRLFSLPRC